MSARPDSAKSNPKLKTLAWTLPRAYLTDEEPSNGRRFPMPREGFNTLPSLDGAAGSFHRYDARDFLHSHGIEIPNEGEAIYFEETEVLLVSAPVALLDAAYFATTRTLSSRCNWRLSISVVELSMGEEQTADASELSYAALRKRAGDSWRVLLQLDIYGNSTETEATAATLAPSRTADFEGSMA